MRLVGGQIVFSPSDLTRYHGSEFGAWMDRWEFDRRRGAPVTNPSGLPIGLSINGIETCKPDETDAEFELVAQAGLVHEQAYLKKLRDAGHEVIEINEDGVFATKMTLAAMRAGHAFVYQGRLAAGNMFGIADFLTRIDGASQLGSHHYEVWDTKLAKTAKASFIIQLCAYAELLDAIQGRLPAEFVVVLGSQIEQRYRTKDFIHCYRQFQKQFLKFHNDFDPSRMPNPGDTRDYGDWSELAEQILVATDDLSQVANITRNQIQRLNDAGVETMSALAKSQLRNVSGLDLAVFQRLRRQATLQIKSREQTIPQFEIVKLTDGEPARGLACLPPASAMDVFFDMEGFPLVSGGLEYLFGAVHLSGGKPQFSDWWAHDAKQESCAFQGFVDWAYARWQVDPKMHIYHYANYEVAALRRLACKHATKEKEIDQLLRHQVFVDLHRIVRQGLAIGTRSYSLKDIETLYLEPRTDDIITAGGSIVAYHEWLDSDEANEWQNSAILKKIRDYNEMDCVSTWKLTEWLRQQQELANIPYQTPQKIGESDDGQSDTGQPNPASVLAQKLIADVEAARAPDTNRANIQLLLAWLLEFHWREAKPVFWRMFDRHEMTHEELVHDFDCLGNMQRTAAPPTPIKRSQLFEYQFDANQDTKLDDGSDCFFSHDLTISTTIDSLDADRGTVKIKVGPKCSRPPETLSLIPKQHLPAKVIADSIFRFVDAWSQGTTTSQAVDDLIWRRRPRIIGHSGGPLIDADADLLPATIDVVSKMDQTILCIQGPPGTGKTYTSAAAIVALLNKGLRIGVTANSHKAILNLLRWVHDILQQQHLTFTILKVGGDGDDPLVQTGQIKFESDTKKVASQLGTGPILVGGTAWLFSRPELSSTFDYLFVDEAGQFSLANTVGVGLSAKNLVLVGDQMQLSQPVLGTHPGESGVSALEYLLRGEATIPPDFGIFLDQTRRLHPKICDFISEAVYDGRLKSHPETSGCSLHFKRDQCKLLRKEAGIQWVPVEHYGNSQECDEEVEMIEKLVSELLDIKVCDATDSSTRKLTLKDILIVAPFNMQVRQLQKKLPNAKIGSVDKFQGQEAQVVIVSMCSSSLDDSPRGAAFLFDPNRLNVAVTRAKTLAIVVGCPQLLVSRCETIEEMRLANLFCWLIEYAEQM